MQASETSLLLPPAVYHLYLFLALLTPQLISGQVTDYRADILGECLEATDCHCDYACHDADDCCASVNKTKPAIPSGRETLPLTCMSYENVFLSSDVYPGDLYTTVIGGCPEDKGSDEKIVRGCSESDLRLTYDPSIDYLEWLRSHTRSLVPVLSYRNRRLYANMYCALCNGENKDNLHFSKVYLGCRKDGNTTECLMRVKLSKSLIRSCLPPGPKLFSFKSYFFSMDDLFIIPDEYLNNDLITLPINFHNQSRAEHDNSTLRASEALAGKTDTGTANEMYIWAQIILIIFSILGLTLMLFVYGKNSVLRRTLAGLLTMGLGVALLTTEVTFLVVAFGVPQAESRDFCVAMAALFLYSMLSSFVWMTLFAIQLLVTFGNCRSCLMNLRKLVKCRWGENTSRAGYSHCYHQTSPMVRFLKYTPAATVLPLCLVISVISVNEKIFNILAPVYKNLSDSTETINISRVEIVGRALEMLDPGFCPDYTRAWFTNLSGLIIWFLAPAGTMITFNTISLLIVCVQICRLSKDAQIHSSPLNEQERKRREKSKSLAGICGKLAVILGVSWFAQLFAGWWPQLLVMRRLIGLVNSAQGGVIAVSMLTSVKARRALVSLLPESWQSYSAPPSSTQQSNSRDKEAATSVSSRTWTSVLLPKKNRSQNQPDSDPSS